MIKPMNNKLYSLFGLLFLVSGCLLLMTGIHNIDNAWNMKYIEKEYGIYLQDESSLGIPYLPNEVYKTGFIMLISSAFIISLGSYMIGKTSFDNLRFNKHAYNKRNLEDFAENLRLQRIADEVERQKEV